LRNEHKNPTRKDRSVEMDKQTRQVGVKNARQIVGPGESDEGVKRMSPAIEAKKKSSMRLQMGSDLLTAISHLARKLESSGSTSGIPHLS
jgi:hypothetical protein